MTVFNILANNAIQIPYILLTSPDKMDKSAVKFVEGIFKGFSELVVETDIGFAASDVFRASSKWLTAITIFTDLAFWLEVKNGAYTFLEREAMDLYKRGLIHFSHLCTTLNLLKDCSVELFQTIDKGLGHISILGTQLSFKVLKDYALITASAMSLYPMISSFVETTMGDKDGNLRSMQDVLDNGILTDRFWKKTCTEKNTIDFINNVTKIYVIAGIALGAPYDPVFFVMGLLLGATNIMKYIMEADKDAKRAAIAYEANKPDFARIPQATEEFLFRKPVASA